MSSAKPLGHDGSDGALSPSQLTRTGDERDSKLPLDHDADCSIIDELPCGYLILDIAGTILLANRDFLRMTARSSAQTLGNSFRQFLTSAGAIYFDTQILPLLHLAGRRNEIALDLKLDSARLPVFATFALSTKPGGARAEIKVILVGASERRSFEKQLHQSRLEAEQLSEVIHRSSDGIITLLPTGAVRNWNNGAVELFGYTAAEASGQSLSNLLFLEDYRAHFGRALVGLEQGREFSGESVGIHKDGTQIEVSIKLTPHMEAPGTLVAFSAIIRDITLQKLAERALLQSEKLASVGRLASSIAHEINNPLAAVTNLLYILDLRAQEPELKALIQSAQDELARVSQITTHTLRFHRQSTNPTDLDIGQMFEAVISLYRARLRNSSIVARVERCDAKSLFCHEGELRQVVLNIVGNAVDAMKSGGELVFRCTETVIRKTGEAGVRITIADSGTGMESETMAKIFEPFFSTKGIGGTGLGLWVTKDLVEKNGGMIRVRSIKNGRSHGTVFWLFFPHSGRP
jgi:PAS domain S-box-containing protein